MCLQRELKHGRLEAILLAEQRSGSQRTIKKNLETSGNHSSRDLGSGKISLAKCSSRFVRRPGASAAAMAAMATLSLVGRPRTVSTEPGQPEHYHYHHRFCFFSCRTNFAGVSEHPLGFVYMLSSASHEPPLATILLLLPPTPTPTPAPTTTPRIHVKILFDKKHLVQLRNPGSTKKPWFN